MNLLSERNRYLKPAIWLVVGSLLLSVVEAARADLASLFTNVTTRAVVPRRTSIIYLAFHGLGEGDLSCYGQTNFQTPNLDELAAQGIRFTHYTPGDTNPAVVLNALLHGGSGGAGGSSVAEILQDSGYATGAIGEWPAAREPWHQGFDEFAGFLNPAEGTDYYAPSFWRYSPKMFYNTVSNSWARWSPGAGPNNGGREMILQNSGGKKGFYLPDFMLAGWVENFVRIHEPKRYTGFRPFFLMANLSAPRTAAAGRDDFPVPSDAPYSDAPWPQAARNRAALIARLDGDIGALMAELKTLKMTNNVAIFVTSSDPPEKFTDPHLNFFRNPADFQSQTNGEWTAPMIVYWPGTIPAGQVSDYPWSAKDFLPTALEIGFSPVPEKIEGHSILPVLLGEKKADQPQ